MINHPEWNDYGTTILRANEEFHSRTTYAFSVLA
jgi:galactose mutarotase-like enzyme